MEDEAVITTVAVGTDGSDTAEKAVNVAAEIARRAGAKLVLLSAFKDSVRGGGDDIERQWVTSSSARVKSTLDRLAADLNRKGVECETRAGEGDDAGEVLVSLADACSADLLVIGNKGMKRRLLGSVPNTVTHKAGCSVLVVKTT